MLESLSPLPLAAINFAVFRFEPWMMGIIIPVVGMIFVGVLIVSGMYFQHRRRELWHQTARVALERGQPIPEPSPDAPAPNWQAFANGKPADPGQRARGYLIGGLINIGIGAGMALAFANFAPVVSYISAIPICIGLALMIGAWVEGRAGKSQS